MPIFFVKGLPAPIENLRTDILRREAEEDIAIIRIWSA